MKEIELEPKYSTFEIPGHCLKCLAEHEYETCLRTLLRGEHDNDETIEKFEAMLSLLKSADLKELRNKTESHLSDGKKVKLIMRIDKGTITYEVKTG